MKPANCPLCGHHMEFNYYGTALEIYGNIYQSVILECSNDKCETSFGASTDLTVFEITESQIISAWNLIVNGVNLDERQPD